MKINKSILKAATIVIIFLFFTPNLSQSKITKEEIKEQLINSRIDFDKIMDFIIRFGKIPSLSAAIIKNNQTVWSKSYGLKDIEENQKATPDTQYLIASISKTITATALLQLYDKGLFNLDDNVNDYLDFDLLNPYYEDVNITFKMLLTHTSSLDYEAAWFYNVNYTRPDPPSLKSWMQDYFYENDTLINDRWLNTPPGSSFKYSNLGFCILGRLVELISGQNFNDYCKKNIFLPLEMHNTSFNLSDLNYENIAKPYVLVCEESKVEQNDLYLPIPHYSVILHPAGGLRTSVNDLSHFLIAHNNEGKYKDYKLLNESTVELMHSPHFMLSKKGYIGLGWGGSTAFPYKSGHGGSLYCYNSDMKIRSLDKSGIIFFVNRDLGNDPKGRICLKLIRQLLFLKAFKPVESVEKIGEYQSFTVPTSDGSSINLRRYVGDKRPIVFIHGAGVNHWMFDVDKDHSIAQYLNKKGWDVWMLDLRTHDGDGDFKYALGSDREYIDRYWDFDNTLLKIDVVTAVDFVKNQTDFDKIFLSGHSYGGYLAYAYAMIIGEENLSGIITTGSCPYANPPDFQELYANEVFDYGYEDGIYAYVDPDGKEASYMTGSKLGLLLYNLMYEKYNHSVVFYEETTPYYIQKKCVFHSDAESAGLMVDLYFGKDPEKYGGDWVDPQTLYNYSDNLDKITVPIQFIAGEKDPQDPADGIYSAYENVSSVEKEYYCFANHSHMDLLMGDDASSLIFPKIDGFMDKYS